MKVPSEELTVFTREFAAMHAAGISLVRALDFYSESSHTDLGRICSDMVARMEAGTSLSRAMRQYPLAFTDVYASLVEAGEQSGELREILHKLADLHERNRALRQRVIATLTYPAILLLASAACLCFFIFVVLPSILPLFESLKIDLPLITRVLAEVGRFLHHPLSWLGMAGLGAGAMHLGRVLQRRTQTDDTLRRRLETFILRIPAVGPVIEKVIAARMIYTISTLMQSGMFMETSLLKAGKVAGNLVFEERMKSAVEDIHDGDLMSSALERYRVFPRTILQIIAASEEAGGLTTSLQRAARMYEEDVEISLASLSALLEPLILVSMGLVSAFIVLSIIIPTVRLLNNL
mgnify:CR=1 FL=1